MFHFDYNKAFDLIPRNILFALAEHLGFCPNLLQVMKHMYTNLQRYFRVPGGVSPAFRSTCGILQGCPLSVVFMNLIISVWARAIEAETDALPRAFADDSMVLAKDIKTAKHACNITGAFATITGQELAAKKTMAWSTLKSSRTALRKVSLHGHLLNVFLDIKSLGAQLCSSNIRTVSHYSQRICDAIRIANNVSSLPISSTDRGQVCATKILPKVLYSSEISAPSFPERGRLRSAITRAVWCKRSSRSADVVLSLLHPVHRVDPAAAWAHLCLRQLRRMCLRRPDLVMLIRSLWESPCTKSKFGPITSAKRALDFWVGPGLSLKFLFLQLDPL